MFTGVLPHDHGIHVYNRDFSGLTREDTFLGEIPEHTALGASANVYASEAFGFDGMFDRFRSVSPDRRFPRGMDVERWGQQCDADGIRRYLAFARDALAHDNPLASLGNGVLVEVADRFADAPFPTPFDDGARLVEKQSKELVSGESDPFFLFTNFMDAHGPFHHVRGYDSSLHDIPVSWELVDWINSNTDRETTIVVTADHGENLGLPADGELLAHKGVLTEGLMHVPLLVLNAPSDLTDIDKNRYVSHLSLGKLLAGLARNEIPDITADRIPGERIGSNMADSATEDERAEWDRMIRVVYDQEIKYEWDSEGDQARYRLSAEKPNWQEKIDEDLPRETLDGGFFDIPLHEYKEAARHEDDRREVDEATRNRLADLGYR